MVTYEVVISAPNQDLKLKPGLTANVVIYTLEVKDVIAVPSKALRFTPREAMLNEDETISDTDAQDKVWTREGTCLKAIPVSVGVTNGMLTQITSGLKAGTKVLTDVTAQQPEEEEQAQQSNPFMPRPGAKKNTKK